MTRSTLSLTTLLPATLLLFAPTHAHAQVAPDVLDSSAFGREPSPPPVHEFESLRDEDRGDRLTKKERRLLAVPREVRQMHADFLKLSRTGLVRLLPRETYDGKLSLRGGGAYYTFTRRIHTYGYGSDVGLEGGRLWSGFAGADIGFLVDLGDAPLESVSADTDGVRFMAEFKTPSAEPKARAAYRQFARAAGLTADGWTYKRSVPAVVGHTYALRSVNYEKWDVLVAFNVLRRDDDGSLLLLWRILKEYAKPTLRGVPPYPETWK